VYAFQSFGPFAEGGIALLLQALPEKHKQYVELNTV
jgi:hypothetical protein